VASVTLLGLFALLLIAGVPVAVALGLSGVAGILVGLSTIDLATVGMNSYNAIAKYPLIAIPLFVLTGMVFERSGVAARLVNLAQAIVGPRRGGLTLAALLVCLIMGGMSGSGPADAAAVATVMIPSMLRAGYPLGYSAGVIAAGASTALLIPPSLALIVYAIQVPGTDLRALFAAGIVPGLIMACAIALPAWWAARQNDFGLEEGTERPRLGRAFIDALPGLMAPVIILGGLRSGLFTPTETAAVAVLYGLIVGGVLYRTLSIADIYRLLVDTAKVSAVVMLIISLAGVFAWAGSTLGSFREAAALVIAISDEAWVVMALIVIFLLLIGMVLDGVSIYLITLPLLIPIADSFDWSRVWFGIVMAITIAIGQFTPPVAVNLMVTARIAGVGMEESIRWLIPILLSCIVALALILTFPGLALWLPEMLGYRVT
jgi:tripartite ATP-independent transporter DctM subunit